MTTRSRWRSTRWPSAGSGTSRSSSTAVPPVSSPPGTCSTISPSSSAERAVTRARVAVLAQDLIWADRLARIVEASGAEPLPAAMASGFERVLVSADAAIVALTARAYDPLTAIQHASEAGVPVLAVGPHDDVAERKRALASGARRALAYRKLADDGPATIAAFLAGEQVVTRGRRPCRSPRQPATRSASGGPRRRRARPGSTRC